MRRKGHIKAIRIIRAVKVLHVITERRKITSPSPSSADQVRTLISILGALRIERLKLADIVLLYFY